MLQVAKDLPYHHIQGPSLFASSARQLTAQQGSYQPASNQGMIDRGSINWYQSYIVPRRGVPEQSSHDPVLEAQDWQGPDIYGGSRASHGFQQEIQPWQRFDPPPGAYGSDLGGPSGRCSTSHGNWQRVLPEQSLQFPTSAESLHKQRSRSTNGKTPQPKDSIDRMINKFDHMNCQLDRVLKELSRQTEELENQLGRKVSSPNTYTSPNPSQLNLSNVHDMSFPLSHTENNTGNSCHQPSSYPGPGSIPSQSTPDLHPQISTLSVHPQSGNWSVQDGYASSWNTSFVTTTPTTETIGTGENPLMVTTTPTTETIGTGENPLNHELFYSSLVPSRSATIEWQRDNDNGEAIFSEEETISTIRPTTNGKGNIEDATPDVNEVDKNIFPVFTTNCFALLTKPEFLSDEQAWHCECSFENVESLDDLGAVENTSGFRFFHSQVVYIVRDPGSIQLFQFKSTELWGSKRAVSSKDREKDVADPRGNHGVTEHCHTTSTTRGYLKARKYLLEWKAQESSNQCVYHLMCSHGECNNNRGSKKLSISDTISHVAKGKSNNKTRINGLDKLPLKGFDILVSNDSYSYPSQIAALGLPWSSHDKKSSHSELDSVQVIVQIAHCIAQGEIDRGFDVSASIFGKWNHGSVKQWLKTNLEECKGTWNFFEKWSSTFEEQLQKLFRFSEIQIEGPQHPMKVWDPGGRGVHQLQTISSPSFLHIRRLGNHRS